MLQLKDIVKDYPTGEEVVKALKGISVNFRKNEFVAILGQSGCGKTTLLNIVGGLDQYTSGDLIINGKSTKDFKARDWDSYRNNSIGFVFQSYNLIPHQTVLSNVELALTLSGVSKTERRKRAKEVLEKVGLGDQLYKKPNQMSGGQMQRVAIARALINDPDILLADEPTGALDSDTSVQIMDLLKEIANDKLVIMVTHNPELAEMYSTRIVKLLDGKIIDDSNPFSDEEEAKESENPYEPRKTSMSFFTAFSLSLNNLMTKKGRTFLTAFAGSIGIIGIALILSLSSGFQGYINDVQEETLSSYPIMIQKQAMDYGDLMSEMMGDAGEDEERKHEDGKVYSGDIMGDMLIAMVSDVKDNDLESFMEYIEDEANGFKDITSDISYTYDTPIYVFNENGAGGTAQVNPSTLLYDMGLGGMAETQESMSGMMSAFSYGSTSMDMWVQLMNNRELLEQQYDVLAGHWPESKNEVVLVVDSNNEISDFTLYTLGIRDSSELKGMVSEILAGGDTPEIDEIVFTYEDLLNLKFKVILPSDLYKKNDDGTWTDMSGDEDYMADVISKGLDVQISAVIRPSETAYATSIQAGMIGYTSELAEYVVSENEVSEVMKAQMDNPDTDIFTGLPFDDGKEITVDDVDLDAVLAEIATSGQANEEMQAMLATMSREEIFEMLKDYGYFQASTATYEDNMSKLGYSNLAKPASISLYCTEFADKDKLTELIDQYNENFPDREITYTDYIGLMLSSVTKIINAITYVLIAFVAISLIVSSIMIGIITYISVLERTKEIGILRSIGASKRDISRVFNAETFIIGLFSGLIGIGVTVLLNIPISKVIESVINVAGVSSLPWQGGLALVIISVILTLIGGLIPSKVAAKKDPVIALRSE
ncbi:MAG: ABC transporter ATP-binding protein/permease [Coprococcus sp.]|nr:ABC transporter ATP-binding protein/permease [Coprococcus sp.]